MLPDLSSFQAFAFDFDGVIIDSEEFKHRQFCSLFEDYPEKRDEIAAYNHANAGVSRIYKIEHVLKNILHKPCTPKDMADYADRLSERVMKHYFSMPLVEGIDAFLAAQTRPCYITSAAMEDELRAVLIAVGLQTFFRQIFAYPTPKAQALSAIASSLSITPKEILFFGDALADERAAREAGVTFIARTKTPEKFPVGTKSIPDFRSLPHS
jgi:phosphoglycolate phosphatase-like HAD superfamily hydrolase